jgi:hypothetical protein
MTVVDTLHNLLEAMGGLNFGEKFLFDNLVEQLSSSAQLGDEVEVLFVFEVLVQLEDMWVIKLLENGDLCLELIHVLDLLSSNGLACSVLLADSMSALGDDSESTCSQGFLSEFVNLLEWFLVLQDHSLFVNQDISSVHLMNSLFVISYNNYTLKL